MSDLLLLTAAAAGKDPPIIDLDSTVFLQLGVFLITALVLSRFLFRPYLAVRAAREAGIDGARREAVRMQEQVTASTADYEQALARARVKANDERAKLRAEATATERELLEQARTQAQAALEVARGKLAADTATARVQLEPRAQEIARAIAHKILGREVA